MCNEELLKTKFFLCAKVEDGDVEGGEWHRWF